MEASAAWGTFRYVYDGAARRLAGQRGLGTEVSVGSDGEEDEGIDEVRHHDPREDFGPMPQDVQYHYEAESEYETSTEESSTSASGSFNGVATTTQGSEDLETGESQLGSSSMAPGGHMTGPGGVRYRAEDGFLVVVYCDDEMRIPLEGWSFEEIYSVVRSIQEGNWDYFREALAFGGRFGDCCGNPSSVRRFSYVSGSSK